MGVDMGVEMVEKGLVEENEPGMAGRIGGREVIGGDGVAVNGV